MFEGSSLGFSLGLDLKRTGGTLSPDGTTIILLSTGGLSSDVTFTRASTATYFDSAGNIQSAATNIPRFDYDPATLAYLGLRIEGGRTNSIRNSTMVGASASPSTLPTNWVSINSSAGTIVPTIMATGTINGMEYVDVKVAGTSSGSGSYTLAFESSTQITAATADTWSTNVRCALIAGTLTNITSINTRTAERTLAGSLVLDNLGTDFKNSLTSALARFTTTVTLSGGATVERVQSGLNIRYTGAVAIDVTLRLTNVQLELGASSSSFIPTTTAAATRASDVATVVAVNAKPWFNALEGTLLVNYQRDSTVTLATTALRIDSGADAANIRVFQESSGSSLTFAARVDAASVNQVAASISSGNANIRGNSAFGYKVDDYAFSVNGSAVATDTLGTIPTGLVTLRIGSGIGSGHLFGWILGVTYYPTRLLNARLEVLSV